MTCPCMEQVTPWKQNHSFYIAFNHVTTGSRVEFPHEFKNFTETTTQEHQDRLFVKPETQEWRTGNAGNAGKVH